MLPLSRGRNLGAKQIGAEKNRVEPGKSGTEFLADLSKRDLRSTGSFCALKSGIFGRSCNFPLMNSIFPTTLHC
jgi:hypothetical protein